MKPHALLAALLLAAPATHAQPDAGVPGKATLTQVATFDHVPVGVAVSPDGRVFLAFSRAIDPKEPYSVAELEDGKPEPFPPGFEQSQGAPAPNRLLSVQSVVVDGKNRLWMLDTGKVGQAPIAPGSAKLVAYDLTANRVVKTVTFPAEVAGPTAFLNDVRIDPSRGKEGLAYLTDASAEGPNGLVVVDLASGKSTRRLDRHPSTRPDRTLTLHVEGRPLVLKAGPSKGQPFAIGADGLALSPDRKHLFYAPLTSRHLYRVDVDALADTTKPDAEVAKTVKDLGVRPGASDGIVGDSEGRLYLTDFEHNALRRRTPDGKLETLVQDERLQWPDTLALASDGTLYVTVTQIHRSELLRGKDERQRPFALYSLKTDAQPMQAVPRE